MRYAVLAGLLVMLHAQVLSAQDATAEARRLLNAGVDAFDARDYDRALDELGRSIALVPSQNTRLWIARSLRRLGRNAEAAAEYERTIREIRARNEPRYEPTRHAATMELEALSALIGRIRLEPRPLPEGAQVVAAGHGRTAQETADAFPVPPGTVSLIVRDREGNDLHNGQVTVRAGEVVSVNWQARQVATTTATTVPEPVASSPPGTSSIAGLGWTSLGIGAGSLAAFATLLVFTQRQYEVTRAGCGAESSPGCTAEQLAPGLAMQNATNGFLAAGIAATALGIVLEIIDAASHGSATSTTSTAGWHLRGDGLTIRF